MNQEMVERVARAISEESGKDSFISFIGPPEFLASMDEFHRERLCRQARAAIEAMRHITHGMDVAGAQATVAATAAHKSQCRWAWEAMISEALK